MKLQDPNSEHERSDARRPRTAGRACGFLETFVGFLSLWLGTAMYLRCWMVLIRFPVHAPQGADPWVYMWNDTLHYDWGWLAAMFFAMPILGFFGGATQIVGSSSSTLSVVQGVNLIDGAFDAINDLANRVKWTSGMLAWVASLTIFAALPAAFFVISCVLLYYWWFHIALWFAGVAPKGSSAKSVLVFVAFVRLAGILIPPVLYLTTRAVVRAVTTRKVNVTPEH